MHESNQRAPKATKNMSESEMCENTHAGGESLAEASSPKVTPPKAKKAKTDKSKGKDTSQDAQNPSAGKTPQSTKSVQSPQTTPSHSAQPTQPTQPRIKRGPARPHRRLEMEVIDSRITKLQKRLDRARSQIDDAARHVEGYLRERDFRAKEVV